MVPLPGRIKATLVHMDPKALHNSCPSFSLASSGACLPLTQHIQTTVAFPPLPRCITFLSSLRSALVLFSLPGSLVPMVHLNLYVTSSRNYSAINSNMLGILLYLSRDYGIFLSSTFNNCI